MKVVRFHAENFVTFPVIDLDFMGTDRGLTLVDGWNHDQGQANGAGKSVLFSAIAFAIFGKTVTDINLQDLISEWGGTLKTSVTLVTAAGELIIIRTRKSNSVKLFIADVEFKGTAESVEKRILEVVGLTFEQFLQVAYFYQGARDRFVDVNDTAKKSFLASVLGLDKCETAYQKAHEKLKVAESSKATVEGSLSAFVSVLQTQETALDRAIQDLESFRLGKAATVETIRARYVDNDRAPERQAQLDQAKSALAAATAAAEEARYVALPDRKKLADEQELSIKVGQLLARTRGEVEGVEREVRTLRRDRERLGSTKSPATNCYACGQVLPLDTSAHDRIHKEIEAKDAEIKGAEERLVDLQKKTEKAETLLRKTSDAAQQLRALDDQVRAIERKQTAVQIAAQSVKIAEDALANQAELQAQKQKAMERELAALEDRERSFNDRVVAAKQAKTVTLAKVDDAKDRLAKIKDEVAYLQETKRIFSPTGLRAHVVDGVVAELNERIAHYLGELFSGQMRFHYDLDESGKLIGKLFFAGRERSSIATLSGGQRQRVRLAVDLALSDVVANRLAVKTNVMFLDEVTDGMDSIGREGLMLLLEELERSRDAIFVADHESEFKSRFSRSIWLELKAGQTTLARGV